MDPEAGVGPVRLGSRFSGAVALVTGAGSGIGAAVAARLLDEGAEHVWFADIDKTAVAARADGRPGAQSAAVDVADPEAVADLFSAAAARHGRLDLVVHAAAVDDADAKQVIADAMTAGRPPEVTATMPDAAWRRVLSVNLDGTFHILRESLRTMAPRGRGAVVVVGSSAAFDAPTGYAHYSASKAGVHALAQSVAKEAIAFGVRVNVLAPGPTLTAMAERTPAVLRASMSDPKALPYAGADQMADVALFLGSADASHLVGAVVLANGGRFTVS